MFENRRLRLAATAALIGSTITGTCGMREKGRDSRLPPLIPATQPALEWPLSLEPVGSAAWRKEIAAKVGLHPELLRSAGREAQADREIVKAAVSANGLALRCAALSLREDSEIASIACHKNPAAFHFVEETLRLRNDFLCSVLELNGRVLFELPPPFRAERRYALCALRSDKTIFPELAKELRDDARFLECAVIENPRVLGEIPEEKRSRKLCEIALSIRSDTAAFVPTAFMQTAEDGKWLAALSGRVGLGEMPYGTDAYREAVLILASELPRVLDEVNPAVKSDAVLARRLVAANGEALAAFSDKIRDNREVAAAAVKSARGSAYPFLSTRLKRDRELALLACAHQPNTYHHLPERLKADPEIIKAAMARDPLSVSDAPLKYRKDRGLVMRLVKRNGFAVLGADGDTLADRELMEAAVRTSPLLLLSLAPLGSDMALYRTALEREPLLAWNLPEELKDDLELARTVIKRLPRAIGCFGPAANSDPELVKLALSNLPDYESPNLDDELDLDAGKEKLRKILAPEPSEEWYPNFNECARQEALAKERAEHQKVLLDAYDFLAHIPLEVFKDKELALLAVSKDPKIAVKLAKAGVLDPEAAACAAAHWSDVAHLLPLGMQGEPRVLKALAPNGLMGIARLDASVRNDPSKMRPALNENGLTLFAAGSAVRSNRSCVLSAVEENGTALEAASYDLRFDKGVVMAAVKNWGRAIHYASPFLRADKEVIQAAVGSCGAALRYLPIVSDRTLAWTAFGTSAAGYWALDSELKSDPELTLRALRLDPAVLLEAADSLFEDPKFLLRTADTSLSARPYLLHRLGKLPKEVEERFRGIERALADLNIRRPVAFDASGEVIRGRFAAASPEMKKLLTAFLGEAFFAGINSDTRPLVVLPFPRYDHNFAFEARESGFDLVDQLTGHYQVCYYEVGGTEEFAESVREATIARKRQAQLFFVPFHGSQNWAQMGWDRDPFRGGLSIYAGEQLKDLGPALKPGGLAVIFGCNTGKGGIWARANVARFFSNLWPQATVQAPVETVMGVTRLNGDGSLRGLQFFSVMDLPSPALILPRRK